MKNVIKAVIFTIIFILIFIVCYRVMMRKGYNMLAFYEQDENSLDLIFFGSSQSYASFDPRIIDEKTGLNTWNLATAQQPIPITYYYMKEALKTQHPKYFVLEIRMLSWNNEYAEGGIVRGAVDGMKLTQNKIDAVNTSVKDERDRLSYLFNFIMYHSRYKELSKDDIKWAWPSKKIKYSEKGYVYLKSDEETNIDNDEIISKSKGKEEELLAINQEYFDKIINLAEENNIQLILVKVPCQLDLFGEMQYNTVKKIAAEKNLIYIDYNEKFDELPGAEKVSNNFADYINSLEKEK